MKRTTCIAIGVEPLALLVFSQLCERFGGLDLTTFSEPRVGLEEIRRNKPDLVFLDIEMNSISGLDIAHALPDECCFIFTTAHAQYALNGFELDAVDFLHKPFAYERFEKAVEKALRRIESQREKSTDSIVVKQDYNNVTVSMSDILYIEAMENYTKIFKSSGGYILSRTNMKTIQELLPESNFLRIHRSYIVPIEKVEIFSKKRVKLIGQELFLPVGRFYANHIYDTLISRNSGHIFPNT